MRCPTCGGTEVYRSRRDWFERAFNWLFWYHQRPYRCANCMTRYWMRLEPRVWRHAFRLRLHKLLRAWGFYIGALVLVVLIAWSLNFLHQRSQDALDPLLRAAVRQNLQEQWKSLTPEQKEQYRKQAEQMNLSAEEKEAAKALLGK